MDYGIIAVRYAKALLKFAVENGEQEVVYAEMQQLSTHLLKVPALAEALHNPTLKAETLKELLCAAVVSKSKSAVSQTIDRFFSLLLENKRSDLMLFVAKTYQTIYRKQNQITGARLITAVRPSDNTVARMQQLVGENTGGQVDFEVEVDPSLQGGFILEYDTYRMDASVKGRLAQLKRALL